MLGVILVGRLHGRGGTLRAPRIKEEKEDELTN